MESNLIKDYIIQHYSDTDDVMFADGLDDAIIGFDPNLWKVVYSRAAVLNVLMERDGMNEEEAVEFAEYNIYGAYIGEKTPVWVEDFNW